VGYCIKHLYIVAQTDKIYTFKILIARISESRLTVFQRGALYEKMRRYSNLLKIFKPKGNVFNTS